MQKRNMEEFIRFAAENKECQEKLASLNDDLSAITAYAGDLGYEISPEELQEYREQAQKWLKEKLKKKSAQPDASTTPGVQAFYALIKLAETDGIVAKRLAELGEGSSEALIAYGKEKGFIFNEQDVQAIGKDILEPANELSEEELELAAGGVTITAAVVLSIVALGVTVGGLAGGAVVGGAGVGAVLGVMALVQ